MSSVHTHPPAGHCADLCFRQGTVSSVHRCRAYHVGGGCPRYPWPILSGENQEYVEAAKVLGFSTSHILFKEILPNTIAPLLVICATNFASALLIESGLSFWVLVRSHHCLLGAV